MPITGGCRCGAVRYALDIEDLPRAYACHCHQCQRWSGSAFSLQAMVPEAAITLAGPVVSFDRVTEDRVSTQHVCGECHGRIYNTNTRRPGVAIVRAGTLDRSEELECAFHIYTAYRQQWFALPEGVPAWAEIGTPEEMIAALQGG